MDNMETNGPDFSAAEWWAREVEKPLPPQPDGVYPVLSMRQGVAYNVACAYLALRAEVERLTRERDAWRQSHFDLNREFLAFHSRLTTARASQQEGRDNG